MEGLLGVLLIAGLFVAYFVQRRARNSPPPEIVSTAEVVVDEVPARRGSSPNWGAPILFCGFLYGATSTVGTWWSALWQVLFFALVAVGAYTTFSAKEFAGELARDPEATRREHYLKFGVPYVVLPLVAWVLTIVAGWRAATLLPAVPWALLVVLGIAVSVTGRPRPQH